MIHLTRPRSVDRMLTENGHTLATIHYIRRKLRTIRSRTMAILPDMDARDQSGNRIPVTYR